MHLALMSSENRAANALGRNYPGGLSAFVVAMNAKAKELGMGDTRYVEPTGLSSSNQSSARDLAVLVNAAHQVPLLREYSTTQSLDVELGRRQVQFHTTDRLVANPTWDIGLQKTGFINEAGQDLTELRRDVVLARELDLVQPRVPFLAAQRLQMGDGCRLPQIFSENGDVDIFGEA